MKSKILISSILIFFSILFSPFLFAQDNQSTVKNETPKEKKYTNKGDNSKCFTCHAHNVIEFKNEKDGKIIKRRMSNNFRIDTVQFYNGNHWNFKCTDCHDSQYGKTPHDGQLRFTDMPKCLDCHGGDPAFAQYKFEQISVEFEKSVHSTKHRAEFSCWSCHDPHTYKINARNKQDVKTTIAYDNSICLSCHADVDKYQLISSKINPNILTKHEWLPNQANHFKNVRCIECHAQRDDSILVAHNIQPKAKAVKKCVECHSKNPVLLQSLYKFKVQESRAAQGFLNSAILTEGYVIGANRNTYLNIFTIIAFACAVLGISIHAYLRSKIK